LNAVEYVWADTGPQLDVELLLESLGQRLNSGRVPTNWVQPLALEIKKKIRWKVSKGTLIGAAIGGRQRARACLVLTAGILT
jgi:hypothetical protein